MRSQADPGGAALPASISGPSRRSCMRALPERFCLGDMTQETATDVRTEQHLRPSPGRRARAGRGRAHGRVRRWPRSPRAATFDELKAARLAHLGRQAPLILANAEIGALPPEAKAEAGQRVGAAKRRLAEAHRRAAGRAGGRAGPRGPGGGDRRRHAAVGPAAAPAPGIRSPRSPTGWPTCSSAWATRSPRVRRSRPSGTTSTR